MDFATDRGITSDRVRHAGVDCKRIELAVREILHAIGEDPDRDGLRDTPERVARAYAELGAGLHEDPTEHLKPVFDYEGSALVRVNDIEFFSLCEHHMLPFFGKVSISYKPRGGKVFGLSKLARLVTGFARRLQVQERLTSEIANAIVRTGLAEHVSVEVEAHHMCMSMRGAKCSNATTVTTESR